ncbi:MAG: 50S ribosomal protein L28 [Candidatus Komeilibacteria bacterium]|nr:50S ribosomal protein L28 [Candidatus Komeilibacteria bacterium]
MSKVCQICDRGTSSGQTKSHSQIKTKRQVKINLQSKSIGGQSIRICTSCLRTLKKK